MLNIGKLAADGGSYYLSVVASGVEDYYLGAGEAPGRWVGAAAAELGLEGLVDAADLEAVLAGRHPAPGAALRTMGRKATVPGFDLTFRAPKSVALVWGLGEREVSDVVRAAHDAAVADALGYLERHALRTRVGADRTLTPVTGAVAAVFRHRTSRAGDPLLHSHCLVANLAHTPDGRWRTIDSRSVYRHAKTAGYLYQASLRHRLTTELGVAWQPVVNGVADVAGIPRAVVEHFSQRRAQILRHLSASGHTSAKAAQTVTLATRRAKDGPVDGATLQQRWRRRSVAVGFGPADLTALLHVEVRRGLDDIDVDGVVAALGAADGLTAHQSTFTRRDVLQAWCDRLPRGASVADIEQLADATLDHAPGTVLRLGSPPTTSVSGVHPVLTALAGHVGFGVASAPGLCGQLETILADSPLTPAQLADRLLAEPLSGVRDPAAVLAWRIRRVAGELGIVLPSGPAPRQGRLPADPTEARYSTPALVAIERQALGHVAAARAIGTSAETTEAVLADWSLSTEQQAMVRRLLTSRDGVLVVVGRAGSGKTTALAAAVQGWTHEGHTVTGTALAARATKELSDRTQVPATTLDRLLGDLATRPLDHADVIIVDEAGMVGTRKLAALIAATTTAGAKLVLVGDHRQLPEIDAGGLFRALAETTDSIHLTSNRRQHDPAERDAVDAIRNGDLAAVPWFLADGRSHIAADLDAAAVAAVEGWWRDRDAGRSSLLLAATIEQVAALNQAARAHLDAGGRLFGAEVAFGATGYRVGDEVVCRRNDVELGLLNGTTGVVPLDTTAGLFITDSDGTGRWLPAAYVTDHVEHGYATTVHRAQGPHRGHHPRPGPRRHVPRAGLRHVEPPSRPQPCVRRGRPWPRPPLCHSLPRTGAGALPR